MLHLKNDQQQHKISRKSSKLQERQEYGLKEMERGRGGSEG